MIEQSITSNLKPGTLIDGRYQLIELVGEGAMGAVMLCEDVTLKNTPIVLKFLKPEWVKNKKSFERFQNEALLMRELNHPNVVHVYDLCKINNDEYYISMEYITGTSLRGLLEDSITGNLTLKDSIKILKEIAKGMSYAHSKDIIHRDLKPDNVLISREGEVKITDFGLGKALVISEDITDLGEAVGTPHYMAPEQLKGLKLDIRCDIYSFGILAYELITGEKPFKETNYLKLAKKHIEDPFPKIDTEKHNIPNWFNSFLAKCTAKNKKHRFQSFGEIEKLLASFNDKKSKNNTELIQNISGKMLWKTKWAIEKWKIKNIALSTCFILTSAIFILLLGKSNPKIRSMYSHRIILAEHYTGLNLESLKNFAFGESISEHAKFDSNELITAVSKGREETASILIKAGVPLTAKNHKGESLLMIAVKTGASNIYSKIIKKISHKEINTKDILGFTALVHAIRQDNISLAKTLIHSGADINITDKELCTPLMHAVDKQNEKMVELLLKKGAVTTLLHKSKKGKTALKIAQRNKNKKIIVLLKKSIS